MADAVDLTAHPVSRQRATLRIAALQDTRDRLARDLAEATAALAAVTADRDRAVRERDEAVAAARRDAFEEAARIAEEPIAEDREQSLDHGIGTLLQPTSVYGLATGTVAAAIRAAALAARTGGRADGE